MISYRRFLTGFALSLAAVTPAMAQVTWADWTATGTNSVTGSIGAVGVTFTGPYFFAQTACGTDYWTTPATYISPTVPTAPPPCDIIALSQGGTKTITFTQAVVNPLIALTSWNSQPGVVFSGPIEILSQGPGFWGSGTFSVVGGNTLVGSGEAHGVIRLLGTYTSFTFNDADEVWHGFTVGIQSVAPPSSVVPEPATYALMSGGLVILAAVRRRRRNAA